MLGAVSEMHWLKMQATSFITESGGEGYPHAALSLFLSLSFSSTISVAGAELDMDWIHPRIGLDWIGWDDCDPVFIKFSNH